MTQILRIILLVVFLSLLPAIYAEVPSNDATFYVELQPHGAAIYFAQLPYKELDPKNEFGVTNTTVGILISEGDIDQTFMRTDHWIENCNRMYATTCTSEVTIKGTYQNGQLDIEETTQTKIPFTGSSAPINGNTLPIKAGTVETGGTFKFSGTFDEYGNFNGNGKATYNANPKKIECGQWEEQDGEKVCIMDGFVPEEKKTVEFTVTGRILAPRDGVFVVSRVKGDGEYMHQLNGDTMPIAVGTVLKTGDFIGTDYGSEATIDFGYATLVVESLTLLRIDESVTKENIKKAQLSMRVGSVRAVLKHTPAIRSDFSVSTPTAIAGIRGSAMRVVYDNASEITTVAVIEDQAYVQNLKEETERTVTEGTKVTIDREGHISDPIVSTEAKNENSEKDASNSTSQNKLALGIGILAMILAVGFIWWSRRKKIKK